MSSVQNPEPINKIKFIYYGFLFVLAFSLVFFTIKLFNDYKDMQGIRKAGVLTEATVSSIVKDNFGRYPSYSLYLKYDLANGETIESLYRRSVGGNKYALGQKLNIIYDLKDPKVFFFDNDPVVKQTSIYLIIDVLIIFLLVFFRKKIFNYYQTP